MAICKKSSELSGSVNRFEKVVLGAGISGLALAWRLEQEGCRSLLLLERSDRVGGWIETTECDGMLFERGPRSCRSSGSGQATLRLARAVGLENEIIRADPAAKIRYLWSGGGLRPLPYKPYHLLTQSLIRRILPTLLGERRRPVGTGEEESIRAFVTRRFSSEVADLLFDPLTAGIHGGEIDRLSMQSCYPTLVEWERRYGSVVKGMRTAGRGYLFSFRKGMEQLPVAIAGQIRAPIWTHSPATALTFHDNGVEIATPSGLIWTDHLYATLPACALAPLIPALSPLREIPTLSLTTVSLGYRRSLLKRRGFGYLIPRNEREEILGCVWDSSAFPEHNQRADETRLTVMISGDREEGEEIAKRAVKRHLGINEPPDVVLVKRAKEAIPQYTLGHSSRLDQLTRSCHPRLSLLGNSYWGISVNDCVERALDGALP